MADRLCAHELWDLCVGKPALRSLSVRDTVGDALEALKRIDDAYVSIWNCHHSFIRKPQPVSQAVEDPCCCTCIGKVCMVDIICFLSSSHSLHSPISSLLHHNSSLLLRHLPPTASILEAIHVMHEGVQNVVIRIPPIQKQISTNNFQHSNNTSYCWLTQEDLFRYLLNSISLFSPTPSKPINTLGIIDTQNLFAVWYDDPASSALDLFPLSLAYQSSIAVLHPTTGKFLGEISPSILNSSDESLVPAIATLSAGHLIDHCGGRRPSEPIVCYPWSSLVAVMIQALAHRVTYVWVLQEDGTLTGIVTFQGILKVFREHLLQSIC